MRRRAVVATGAALLVLSACSGSGSGNASSPKTRGASGVVSATRAAVSARFVTVSHSVESGVPDRAPTSTTDGVVDFSDHTGSQTRTSSDSHVPPQEYEWVDGVGYQQADAGTIAVDGAPKGTEWLSTDSKGIAAAGGCVPYLLVNTTSALLGESPGFGLPRPDGILDTLRAAGASLVRLGSGSVRGVSTTHWRIGVTSAATTTTTPANCRANLPGVSPTPEPAEIWTDAQSRLRRVVYVTKTRVSNLLGQSFSSLPRGRTTTIVDTTTTEFFGFGVRVHVSAPPAGRVYDVTAPEAALLAGPGTVLASGWRAAAHGDFRGKAWTVWYARSSTKWRCYDVSGLPASPDALPAPSSDIFPKHDGRASDCSPPVEFPPPNGAFTAILAGADGSRWVLVGRVDDSASDARLRLASGDSTNLPIDSKTRLVQWSGPRSPAPTEVTSGKVSCTLSADTTSNDDECQGVDDAVSSAPPTKIVVPAG